MAHKIQEGNSFNTPLATWYAESDEEINEIPNTEPAGTVVWINKPNNFHVKMKNRSGSWNDLMGEQNG